LANPFKHTSFIPVRSMIILILVILGYILLLYLVVAGVGLFRLP